VRVVAIACAKLFFALATNWALLDYAKDARARSTGSGVASAELTDQGGQHVQEDHCYATPSAWIDR
jgi:hypothetical protein